MCNALFIGKDVGGDYPHVGFRKGTTEYISRRTGKRYVVEPSPDGFLVSSDNLLIYAGSNRSTAMQLIETADTLGGVKCL